MTKGMVTFGADPDKPSSWEEPVFNRPRINRHIDQLISAFVYHKNLKMSHIVTADDKGFLGAYFSRKLKAGVTSQSMLNLIDAFYSSPFAQGSHPVKAFLSTAVQDSLVGKVDLRTIDDYVNWILEGMPDVDFIDDSHEIRKVMLTRCYQGLLRYPDVIIDILKSNVGLSKISTMITSLEELIEWNVGDLNERPDTTTLNTYVPLPKELQSNRRGNLREPAESVSQAILKTKKR